MSKLTLYPRDWQSLVVYLTENPIVNMRVLERSFTQSFSRCDGIRFYFKTKTQEVAFPCQGSLNPIEYNEDGFSRLSGKAKINYYYTGPKPWQDNKEWKRKIEDWDLVFAGLKNFAD